MLQILIIESKRSKEEPQSLTLKTPMLPLAQSPVLLKKVNLQSHAFLQTYGAILPTSLTYINLLARGCSPWRPAAVIGTTRSG